MTDMIWLVSEGDYSEYRIVHAFRDEDTAMTHVREWNKLGGDRDVQPCGILAEPPKLTAIYSAWWSNDVPDRRRNIKDVRTGKTVTEGEPTRVMDRLDVMDRSSGAVTLHCWSLDSQRATKIVADARAKQLAQEAGL